MNRLLVCFWESGHEEKSYYFRSWDRDGTSIQTTSKLNEATPVDKLKADQIVSKRLYPGWFSQAEEIK